MNIEKIIETILFIYCILYFICMWVFTTPSKEQHLQLEKERIKHLKDE